MNALRETAQMSSDHMKATRLIENDSYFDDLITSVDDYTPVKELMQEVHTMLGIGGFHIKEWVISCTGVFNSSS